MKVGQRRLSVGEKLRWLKRLLDREEQGKALTMHEQVALEALVAEAMRNPKR